ncbi:MAG: galactose-1-phosphate uridylyltransferase [Candidatus Sericytochromatia bacterium]|nr:galactose-1-phosphate uridylyltransferase [Candidatus Sericytochromatia bacterium]
MSELRWNPVLREWVVTATHRQDRTFLPPPDYCPLCPTKAGGFPTEVPAEDYQFVVFDNKFPSFHAAPPEPAVDGSELMPVRPAQGVCEVVLYSARHNATLAEASQDDLVRLTRVWRDRYEELGARPEIDYVFIFENKGTAIGVTLHHPHGQIYAFSYLPPRLERSVASEAAHHAATGRCLHCDILAGECADGRRIVAENERFVALVPFYARYPYEVHLYAKAHLPSLSAFSAADDRAFAEVLHAVLRKYDGLWEMSMPYIMVMQQAPTDGVERPGSHFRLEFYPPLRTREKLKYLAGCESGAGTFINDTLPEEKAAELRALAPQLGGQA